MKIPSGLWLAVTLLTGVAFQAAGADAQRTQTANVPAPTPYAITKNDANSRVWERTTYQALPNGKVIPRKHHYTELATGLNHLVNGQWVESSEQIDILPNGTAQAVNGQHQAYFPGDIYSGQIKLVTADGVKMFSRPMGLSYFDGTNSVLIAELTNAVGVVSGSNVVIYPNAFTDFKADLRYTYTKAGLEQDVVFQEQPPTPESFGLSSKTTRLQLLTEFFKTTNPVQAAAAVNRQDGLSDRTLTFGQMKMTRGKAFAIGNSAAAIPKFKKVSVYKSWQHLEGRTFLVEEVPVRRIWAQLEQLPRPAGASPTVSAADPVLHKVSATRLLPPTRFVAADTNTVPLARADVDYKSGVVLDYVEVNTDQTNFTFQGDTTYSISGYVELDGTTTFEGGTILKFPEDGSGELTIDNNMVFETAAYRPAIFTSVNDNSVGEYIGSGSPATGSCSASYLWTESWTNGDVFIDHARFLYAGLAIATDDDVVQHLDDVQFIRCGSCVNNGPGAGTFLNNVLASDCYYLSDAGLLVGNNVTVDGCICGVSFEAGVCFTNCVLANVTNIAWEGYFNSLSDWSATDASADNPLIGSHNGFYNSAPFGDNQTVTSSNPFQTCGGGSYYLATNSVFHNAGTTGIDPETLADIQTKTTYAPMVYSNLTISTATTLSPQAQRDNLGNPDLGYHYDPLDYLCGEVCVTNATLTVNPGTAIGCFGIDADYSGYYGFDLEDGSQFVCQGTAANSVRLVENDTVQESWPGAGWCVDTGYIAVEDGIYGLSPAEKINWRFTDCSSTGMENNEFFWITSINGGPHNFRDCEFRGGSMLFIDPMVNLTNCLFDRVDFQDNDNYGVGAPGYCNNLFYGSGFDFQGGSDEVIQNNLFDQCGLGGPVSIPPDANVGYNAYVLTTNYYAYASSDIILTNPMAYQTGPLGDFYQPTNSPLIDAGSTTADQAGLYYYTTQTNQMPETNSVVDIGYHYVATDADGNPLDTLWSGIPDYLADTNGELAAWELENFGQLGLNPNFDPAGNGDTLLYDYQNGLDPNAIQFSIVATNDYVNTTNVTVQLAVTAGTPGYYALFVNPSTTTNWLSLVSTNLTVNLGPTDGVYTVNVGLRGLPANATQTWQDVGLTLDTTPPLVFITSPTNRMVDQPMIQLQGMASEPLGGLFFDISNALGVVTGQQGFVTGQYYDPNSWRLTTNFFQCYDLPLTNGLNTVTLHATDLFGNTATTNLNYTVDYSAKTNPPAFTLFWPVSGTQISSNTFTLNGQLADYTATITATLTDTNGDTNVVSGVVERDGTFWVDNAPLMPGPNTVTLTIVDAAGNVSVTNIVVYEGGVVLTLDAPDPNSLWNTTVDASGTISSEDVDTSDYTVWVNGVQVTNTGYGDWYGTVPVATNGVAVFDITAYPPGDNPTSSSGGGSGGYQNPADTNAVSLEINMDKPPRVFVANDTQRLDEADHVRDTEWWTEDTNDYSPAGWEDEWTTNHLDQNWTDGQGGSGTSSNADIYQGGYLYTNICTEQMTWPTNNWPWLEDGSGTFTGDCAPDPNVPQSIAPPLATYTTGYGQLWEHCEVSDPHPASSSFGYVGHTFGSDWEYHEEDGTYTRHAQTQVRLATGGRAVPGRQSLIQISGSAYAVLDKRAVPPLFYMAHMQTIPPQSLTVGALGNLDTNGNLYVVLPDGDPDVTVIADGKGYYIFSVSAVKYHLAIAAITNGTAQYLEYAAPTFCVGQQITFVPQWITYPYTYPSAPPYSHATADWTLPGTFVNEQPFPATCDEYYDDNTNLLHQDSATNSALSTSCWYVTGMQGGNASVAMKLAFSNKQIAINAAGTFNVYRPKTVFNPTYIGTPQVVANSALTLYPPMSFAHDVQSDFPGVAGYTQLVGGEYTDSATGNILDVGGVTPQTELDLGELYYGTQPITSTNGSLAFSDAPLVGFSPTTFMTSQNITLNAYLLFKPDGSGSIFVPLRLVTWNLNDSAQYVSGAWSVETGNPVAAPADNDTSAFPLWTNTFSTF